MTAAAKALVAASLLMLCACWNGKDQFHRYMDEGRANGVPLVIYDISANDAHRLYSQPVAVAFVNTQDAEIQSVVLTVSICGIKASQNGSWTLNMGGEFGPDASFMIQPISNPDANGNQYHMELSHMVITSIEVKDAGGTRTYSGKDVSKLIDGRVANYCVGDVI
ncbi:MAG TPA: hypothetical protein VGM16_12370 [Gammaproteobacteria bacterium]|jgi:hypothetical protein